MTVSALVQAGVLVVSLAVLAGYVRLRRRGLIPPSRASWVLAALGVFLASSSVAGASGWASTAACLGAVVCQWVLARLAFPGLGLGALGAGLLAVGVALAG